jgi:hypothetical protein
MNSGMKEIAAILTILFMICAGVPTSLGQDDIDTEYDFDPDDFYTEFEEELDFFDDLDTYGDDDLIDLITELDEESYFDEEFEDDADLDLWDLNTEPEDENIFDLNDNEETFGVDDDTAISDQSGDLDAPKRYMDGSELIAFVESLGFNKSNCPPDSNAPQGSINIWDLNGSLAHSSVVLPGSKQIEMGRKPQEDDPEKYESEILAAGTDPTPSTGEYKLLGTWCPPAGSFVNMTYIKEMVGIDREYGTSTQWNCHGFSATLASKAIISNECIEGNQWVVWYAEKIGWQPIYITNYTGFKEDVPSCLYSGGGLDCSVMLEKTFILGPYPSKEEATAAICGKLTNFRRLSGIYAGLRVADFGGDVHNIENIGCTFPS